MNTSLASAKETLNSASGMFALGSASLSHITFYRVILQNHIQTACQRAETRIKWLMSLESHPFTLNEHYLADYKDKFLSFYKAVRQSQRSPTLLAHINNHIIAPPQDNPFGNPPQLTGISKILSGLSEVGITGVKPEDIPKLLPPDTMEPAITIMAEVRAYFQGKRYPFCPNEHAADLPQWRTSAL